MRLVWLLSHSELGRMFRIRRVDVARWFCSYQKGNADIGRHDRSWIGSSEKISQSLC